MKKYLIVLLLTVISGMAARAQELIAYRDSVKGAYPFLLYVPETYSDTAAVKKPLILFLHGKSRSGRDLTMVTKYGCIDALRRGQDIDALIISPQTAVEGWNPDKLMSIVDWVGARYAYDPDRLYVIGMSMGGWGTFKVVSAYPERVAAAIAECGGYTGPTDSLKKVPLWVLHGTADNVTPLYCSSRVVNQMIETGGADRLRFTWLVGCDHSILARSFLLKQMYDWLFSHSLSDPDRPVCQEYDITPQDLRSAYMHLDPDQRKPLPIITPNKKKQ